MFIFEFGNLVQPQIVVKNLSGSIECRLPIRALDNPDKLNIKIGRKVGDEFGVKVIPISDRQDSVQHDNMAEFYQRLQHDARHGYDIVIYIIRITLFNKIKSRFPCVTLGSTHCSKKCHHHDHEFEYIMDNNDEQARTEIKISPECGILNRVDFADFEDDYYLFRYLASVNGLWMRLASDRLKLNRKLMYIAIKNNIAIIKHIPDAPPDRDKNFSVRTQFRCISQRIHSIPKYIKLFIKNNMSYIEQVSPDIENYRELCILAVSLNPYVYEFIHTNMRDDLKIIESIIQHEDMLYYIYQIKRNLLTKIDYNIIKTRIEQKQYNKNTGTFYDYLPYSLRADITLAKLGADVCNFKSIPIKLRRNEEVINTYLARTVGLQDTISNKMLRIFDFYKKLCKTQLMTDAYSRLPKKYQKNRNFVLETVRNNRSIIKDKKLLIPNKYLDDDEIISYLIKSNPECYKYISTRLQKLKYIAIQSNYLMYPYMPDNIKNDPDIIIRVLDTCMKLNYASPMYMIKLRESIRDRIEIVARLEIGNYENWELIANMLKNREKRKDMFTINGRLISKYEAKDNIELMVIAVKQNRDNIKYIKPKYRNTVLSMIDNI
jgi:hypothetical protein